MNFQLLQIKLLYPGSIPPERATSGSIGYDVFAYLPSFSQRGSGFIIPAGKRALIPLGFAMKCPDSCYGRLAPRSGLSVKKGLDVMAGVIDPDYRGEVHALLLNTSQSLVYIEHGERVAQLILERAETPDPVFVSDLDTTDRGAGGFGSTGEAIISDI